MEEKAEAENGIVGIIPAVNHKKEQRERKRVLI